LRGTSVHLRVVAAWVVLVWGGALRSAGGTVETLEGQSYAGDCRLVPGAVVVHPVGQPAVRVPFSRVLRARIAVQVDATSSDHEQGHRVVTRAGSVLRGRVAKADTGAVEFRMPGGAQRLVLPLPDVSAISFAPEDDAGWARKGGRTTPGVSLKDGDFLEGEFRELRGQKLRVHSLLFGPRQFDVAGQVRSLLIRPVEGPAGAYCIALKNGSVLQAERLLVGDAGLTVEEPDLGAIEIGRDELIEIRASAAPVRSLCDLAAPQVAAAMGVAAATTFHERVTLRARRFDRAVRTAPATSLTFDLDDCGKFDRFACYAGLADELPQGVKVRFVVQTDGRERYRGEEVTSRDAPALIAVPIVGAKRITLTVECTGEVFAGRAVWAEPVLVRQGESVSEGESMAATE